MKTDLILKYNTTSLYQNSGEELCEMRFCKQRPHKNHGFLKRGNQLEETHEKGHIKYEHYNGERKKSYSYKFI